MTSSPAHPQPEPLVLRTDLPGGVVRLSLNAPKKYNALSWAMLEALDARVAEVARDTCVRVVILDGSGKGFCAGHDLGEMYHHRDETDWQQGLFELCSRVMQQITRLTQPVIAQVHGVATAAGLQLASSCDLIVAAEDARFALPGVKVGIFCSTPAVAVGRRIGRTRTMELLLTGTPIDASTAMAWSLVNRVCPPGDLAATTQALATQIAGHSTSVIARGKRAFEVQMDADLAEAYTSASAAMVCDVTSPPAAEGMAAFIERRDPHWPD